MITRKGLFTLSKSERDFVWKMGSLPTTVHHLKEESPSCSFSLVVNRPLVFKEQCDQPGICVEGAPTLQRSPLSSAPPRMHSLVLDILNLSTSVLFVRKMKHAQL